MQKNKSDPYLQFTKRKARQFTQKQARSAQKPSVLVGFGVAVAAAPVVGVLLLGDVVHEVDVGHDADDHLPRLDILLRCV